MRDISYDEGLYRISKIFTVCVIIIFSLISLVDVSGGNIFNNAKIETVRGNYSTITESDTTIAGNHNTIYGDNNIIKGNYNNIYGNDNTVTGNHNKINGENNIIKGNYNSFAADSGNRASGNRNGDFVE